MNKAWQMLTDIVRRGLFAILLLLAAGRSGLAQETSALSPSLTPTPSGLPDPSQSLHINLYGSSIGELAPGTIIYAFDANGIGCGSYEVDTLNRFGFLTCTMDDVNTSLDEGVRAGDNVIFYVNGSPVGSVTLPNVIHSGDRFEALLTGQGPVSVPEPISLVLFGTGLAGLAAYGGWRKRRKQQGGNDDSSISA